MDKMKPPYKIGQISNHPSDWNLSNWRSLPIAQAPSYPDQAALAEVEKRLSNYPPLVLIEEVERLKKKLAAVSRGEALLLQAGDCAESFGEFNASTICGNIRIILQMAIMLCYGSNKEIVMVGRIAGQFAKPRSNDSEKRGEQALPIFRGDIINGHPFTPEQRIPDPMRMERAYAQSAATLNLLRAFLQTGARSSFALSTRIKEFIAENPEYAEFGNFVTDFDEGRRLKELMYPDDEQKLASPTDFFTSHEALLLNYEEALTRQRTVDSSKIGSGSNEWYASSGHMLWLGDRTRQVENAHVEFLRGIENPIGIKCGPSLEQDSLIRLLDRLNPTNQAGKIALISRMGRDKIADKLPGIVKRVKAEGRDVVWICDPMHGNTITSANGYKTRVFDSILSEIQQFWGVHGAESTIPGGVHLELTGKDVTECIGGVSGLEEQRLASGGYETLCDPRLNYSQAIELALRLAKEFNGNKERQNSVEKKAA